MSNRHRILQAFEINTFHQRIPNLFGLDSFALLNTCMTSTNHVFSKYMAHTMGDLQIWSLLRHIDGN